MTGAGVGYRLTPERVASVAGIGQAAVAVILCLGCLGDGKSLSSAALAGAATAYLLGRVVRRPRMAFAIGATLLFAGLVPYFGPSPGAALLLLIPAIALVFAVPDSASSSRRVTRPSP